MWLGCACPLVSIHGFAAHVDYANDKSLAPEPALSDRDASQACAPLPLAFVSCLHWLDSNDEADDSAADQLLSRLIYEHMDNTLLLAAARGHERFRSWRGALPALAAAALSRKLSAKMNAADAGAWKRKLQLQLLADLSLATDAVDSMPQQRSTAAPSPLEVQLSVPMSWLQQEAAALEHCTHRLQAQPASQQQIDAVQHQLVSWYNGKALVNRGYSWVPRMVLFLRILRPWQPFQFGAVNLNAGAAAPAEVPGAKHQVRLEQLHLSAKLCLEAQALPPLAPRPVEGGVSSAGSPGPLVEVEFGMARGRCTR